MNNIADDLHKAYDDGYADGQRDSLAVSIINRQINYCPMCGRMLTDDKC